MLMALSNPVKPYNPTIYPKPARWSIDFPKDSE